MTLKDLFDLLRGAPLIASVQASPGSPVEHPDTLCRLAQASLAEGCRVLRLQGAENIRFIKAATGVLVIGLIKREVPGSDVYITPTSVEVRELLELGCEVIALDGTARARGGESLADLVGLIHAHGRLAMADCDCIESVRHALAAGADLVGTTLAGYTPARSASVGPDFEFLRSAIHLAPGRVIAEGRFAEPWQAQAAILMGATAAVVGGALNDPVKQTRAFLGGAMRSEEPVGAVDIGGTWMRFGVFGPEGLVGEVERTPLPTGRAERLEWIGARILASGVQRVGVSTGGTVDPRTATVTEAKSLIPDYVGTRFAWPGVETVALNDGLATAWGHACHPDFAGLRVATLALGTGVGGGVVDRGRIWMGPGGEYPRLNDQPCSLGGTIEEHLGGAGMSGDPSAERRERAMVAAEDALRLVRELYFPDVVVVCGGVGLSDWLTLPGTVRSPYGENAGLVGAGWLARTRLAKD